MAGSPFESETVRLRPFQSDDLTALRAYLNHPDVMGRRYVPWGCSEWVPYTEGQVQGILERWTSEERGMVLAVEAQIRKHGWLGSEPAEVSVPVGHVDASWDWDPHSPSAAVVIAPEYRRKGYGSEAFRLLLRFLFNYSPAQTVGCWIADWNEAGLAFVQHLGFQVNGRMRWAGLREGRPFDVIITDILRSEWLEREGGQHGA